MREDVSFNLLGRPRKPAPRPMPCSARTSTPCAPPADTTAPSATSTAPNRRSASCAEAGDLGRSASRAHQMSRSATNLPFHLEIAGFSDEKASPIRPHISAAARGGTLSAAPPDRITEKGIERARRKRGELLAYIEGAHRAGPGAGTARSAGRRRHAIAGQAHPRGIPWPRGSCRDDRRWGCGGWAARCREFVLAVERQDGARAEDGLVATVGQLSVEQGRRTEFLARWCLSLDVRHARDARRLAAVRKLEAKARAVARRRHLTLVWTPVQESAAVRFDPALTRLLSASAARQLASRGRISSACRAVRDTTPWRCRCQSVPWRCCSCAARAA